MQWKYQPNVIVISQDFQYYITHILSAHLNLDRFKKKHSSESALHIRVLLKNISIFHRKIKRKHIFLQNIAVDISRS